MVASRPTPRSRPTRAGSTCGSYPIPRGAAPDDLGLFGRLATGASTFELFHNTPGGDELAACLVKHGEFRHFLTLRKPPPPVPTQWVISSGRPDRGIDGLWLRPVADWPQGIYEGPPLLWTRLVVVSELPVERHTLLLRLLGAGAVLKQAIGELKALAAEEPERALALPILVRLRLDVPRDPQSDRTKTRSFSWILKMSSKLGAEKRSRRASRRR